MSKKVLRREGRKLFLDGTVNLHRMRKRIDRTIVSILLRVVVEHEADEHLYVVEWTSQLRRGPHWTLPCVSGSDAFGNKRPDALIVLDAATIEMFKKLSW